ncbi:XRE family transcriptional regulator [bacterium]|nr:MAG: XRE family transcriptional regulator [bacterium]
MSDSPQPVHPGRLLESWRRFATTSERKVSQYALADMYVERYGPDQGETAEVSRRRVRLRIGNYENGRSLPPTEFLQNVADLLEIPEELRTVDSLGAARFRLADGSAREKLTTLRHDKTVSLNSGVVLDAAEYGLLREAAFNSTDEHLRIFVKLHGESNTAKATLRFKPFSNPVLNATLLLLSVDSPGEWITGTVGYGPEGPIVRETGEDKTHPLDRMDTVGVLVSYEVEKSSGLVFKGI